MEQAFWSVVELLGGIRTKLWGVRKKSRILCHKFKEMRKKLVEVVKGISNIS